MDVFPDEHDHRVARNGPLFTDAVHLLVCLCLRAHNHTITQVSHYHTITKHVSHYHIITQHVSHYHTITQHVSQHSAL